MPDVAPRQLCFDRLVGIAGLPEELREREVLLGHHAFTDVQAVHAEVGQLVHDLRASLVGMVEGHAVEMHDIVHHVDADFGSRAKVLAHDVVELLQLLGDHRMAGRIRAGEAPQARERLEHGQGIQPGVGRPSLFDHRALSSRALRAIRMRPGFQNRNRNRSSPVSTSSSPRVPA